MAFIDDKNKSLTRINIPSLEGCKYRRTTLENQHRFQADPRITSFLLKAIVKISHQELIMNLNSPVRHQIMVFTASAMMLCFHIPANAAGKANSNTPMRFGSLHHQQPQTQQQMADEIRRLRTEINWLKSAHASARTTP